MRYLLKHRRWNVMSFDLTVTSQGFNVNGIRRLFNRDWLPIRLQGYTDKQLPYEFKHWYEERMIPKNREDLDVIINSMLPAKCTSMQPYAIAQILSLFAYGRNMTDQYWITPVDDARIEIANTDFPLNGYMIRRKTTYLGMNFFKNGIAKDYAGRVYSLSEIDHKDHSDFNSPDYCTNGDKKKRIIRFGEKFYIEKLFDHMDVGVMTQMISEFYTASEEHPEYLPPFETVSTNFGEIRGYRVPILTNENTAIVTLKELCEAMDHQEHTGRETLKRVIEEYSLNGTQLREMRKIFNSCAKPEYGLQPKDFYENAGVIIEPTTKTIIRPVMWL